MFTNSPAGHNRFVRSQLSYRTRRRLQTAVLAAIAVAAAYAAYILLLISMQSQPAAATATEGLDPAASMLGSSHDHRLQRSNAANVLRYQTYTSLPDRYGTDFFTGTAAGTLDPKVVEFMANANKKKAGPCA